jgi:hypothetical protein
VTTTSMVGLGIGHASVSRMAALNNHLFAVRHAANLFAVSCS